MVQILPPQPIEYQVQTWYFFLFFGLWFCRSKTVARRATSPMEGLFSRAKRRHRRYNPKECSCLQRKRFISWFCCAMDFFKSCPTRTAFAGKEERNHLSIKQWLGTFYFSGWFLRRTPLTKYILSVETTASTSK